jgi:hypothetical protein
MDAYRDPKGAAFAAADALRNENADLRGEVHDLRTRLCVVERQARRMVPPPDGAPPARSPWRLVVLVGLGLAGGSLILDALLTPPLRMPAVNTSRSSALELRSAAETWRSTHDNATCPSPEVLRDDRVIDAASRLLDGWDQPFRIVCSDDGITVMSAGADRRLGTADDIVVPAP